MDRKDQFNKAFMSIALEISKLSRCNRAKVGAIIVKDNNIVSYGYNGTPSGYCNDCEENGSTKKEVIHAECNAILKSKSDINGADLFVTMSPCVECCKLIKQSGIKHVYFLDEYRDLDGLNLLKINYTKLKISI